LDSIEGRDDVTAPQQLIDNVRQVIRGKDSEIGLAAVCLVAGGHLLIEDLPGLGKTMLARSLAQSISGEFRRVQFTPDLLPSDVTGVTVYRQSSEQFAFHPGPVFANIVLADEINRASPKTQAALLEVMEEGRVTVDGVSHPVPSPFMVIATQNPIELEGTHRLPEAQLDRFLMRISMGYPDHASEVDVLRHHGGQPSLSALQPVFDGPGVLHLAASAERIHTADVIYEYIVAICEATRRMEQLRFGVSPRGGLALAKSARALALLKGKEYVTPDEVRQLAGPVLSHRVVLTPEAELHGQTGASAVEAALASVPAPKSSQA
jgi:MoxR-like ATPase